LIRVIDNSSILIRVVDNSPILIRVVDNSPILIRVIDNSSILIRVINNSSILIRGIDNSSILKTRRKKLRNHYDIAEILLKVALSDITPNPLCSKTSSDLSMIFRHQLDEIKGY
jgi:hypothetical protein